MNRYRTRKARALNKLEMTLAYQEMSSDEQEAETSKIMGSIVDAMTKELDESYAEWKERTGGIDPNDSSEEDSSSDSTSTEYEEWHEFDTETETSKTTETVESRPHKHLDYETMAAGISKIWKKFEKKFEKTVNFYSKIGAMEEEEDDGEEME